MPAAGLSLVGFLTDATQAIAHLRHDCLPRPGGDSDDMLRQEWESARRRRGAALPGAGQANPRPVAAKHAGYLDELCAQRWMADWLRDAGETAFHTVEIDPLICHQMTISRVRAAQVGEMAGGRDLADLLPVCLPIAHPALDHTYSPVADGSTSILVKSRRGDLHISRFGLFGTGSAVLLAGARLQIAPPFVHVARVAGRCYLMNGYHRLLGARLAGATHVPCVLRDMPDLAAAGIVIAAAPGSQLAIPQDVLTSDDPPTMGHFFHGRAHEVTLRAKSRIIQVSWHEYTMADE